MSRDSISSAQGNFGESSRRYGKDKTPAAYDDIMGLPRHISRRHPPMPLLDRAAQFSPFAALTGHEEAIWETARQTEEFAAQDEGQRERMDETLRRLLFEMGQDPSLEPEIEVTYFRPDLRKSGGAFASFRGRLKKVDTCNQRLIFADGVVLPAKYILSMERG